MTGIDRLRNLAGAWDEWGLGGTLAEIADQIERELSEERDRWDDDLSEEQVAWNRVAAVMLDMERHCLGHEGMEDSPVARWARELRGALKSYTSDSAEQQNPSCDNAAEAAGVTSEAQKVTRDPAEDVSMSAYDLLPQEDRDALAWVREHGGLESVKKLLDWVVGHCSTKQQLDFDFWLSGRVMYELGFEEDMADRDEVERRLLARLMPEGYEWPRYEDGSPVRIGDVVSDVEVRSVVFRDGGILLSDCTSVPGWGTWRSYKEPIKRPAVLAADCEPLEVGQTVYGTRDLEPVEIVSLRSKEYDGVRTVKCKDRTGFVFYAPDDLTHERPVLDADGAEIREGEMVYHIETGDEFTAVAVDAESGDVHVRWGYDFEDKTGTIDGSYLTHRAPVLAADCEPLEVGQTVWHRGGNAHGVVESIDAGSPMHTVRYRSDDGEEYRDAAKDLTHQRPVADTWERLEEDAEKDPCGYFGFDGEEPCGKCPASGKGCEQTMALDLVRRCRALAERERGE